MAKKKVSFEEALKQLEHIADRIERGEIGLEESIEKYEEGMSLVKHCRDILCRAENKIQQLQQRADGTLDVEEFEGGDAIRLNEDAEQGPESSA
jgi:exodeoxyribonuclease VII small subunit